MLGLKIFTKIKSKKFANDKERKQLFAIQGYYKKKNAITKKAIKSTNLTKNK